ncbi:MAG TPA: hypothetical protein VF272_02140 [Candidatus Saccharimonadia bacterium]
MNESLQIVPRITVEAKPGDRLVFCSRQDDVWVIKADLNPVGVGDDPRIICWERPHEGVCWLVHITGGQLRLKEYRPGIRPLEWFIPFSFQPSGLLLQIIDGWVPKVLRGRIDDALAKPPATAQ